MMPPQDLELVMWVMSFVVQSATQVGPPEGPWMDQETLVLRELLDDSWVDVHAARLPWRLRSLIALFWADQHTWGAIRYIWALQLRTNAQNVLMHLGFWVVEGENMFHMDGGGHVVQGLQMLLDVSDVSGLGSVSTGEVPQFDEDGHYIEPSMGNRTETETKKESDEPK
jgi:hypothetical protein